MMELDQLDHDCDASIRRYFRACDTAQSVLEWLEREALGVKWTATEVDEETLCCEINGFECYCGNGIDLALLGLAGSLDAASCIAARMARGK
jgi:hypothetical protein